MGGVLNTSLCFRVAAHTGEYRGVQTWAHAPVCVHTGSQAGAKAAGKFKLFPSFPHMKQVPARGSTLSPAQGWSWGDLHPPKQPCGGAVASQPSTHRRFWGCHTSRAPSHLLVPSVTCPKSSRSRAGLGTALFRQPGIHQAGWRLCGIHPPHPIPPHHHTGVPVTRPPSRPPAAWPSPETSAPAARRRTCPPARAGAGPGGTRA